MSGGEHLFEHIGNYSFFWPVHASQLFLQHVQGRCTVAPFAFAMPFPLCGAPPTQCEAVTRSGARCSITSASSLRDGSQRLVSEPLRCGGRTCLLHMVHFRTSVAPAPDNAVAVFYLDFETSGLDVLSRKLYDFSELSDFLGNSPNFL